MPSTCRIGLTASVGFISSLAVFGLCLALFCAGLLTRRNVLSDASPSQEDVGTPPVAQVVLVLVDALRPDFVFPALGSGCHGAGGGDRPPMTALRRMASSNAVGLFLVADSPTTTAQRLRAIMTGALPAFLEAGSNFNSDAVLEDSLLQQIVATRGPRAVVLGDDTWLSLFPAAFSEHHTFPSFDVRDLDGNDAEVVRWLPDVLRRHSPAASSRAPLIIAHLLGIDHAGHSFHACHPEMFRKIGDIDRVLGSVDDLLAERGGGNTLLLVMGDHGMTDSGDHGGDSPQETDTILIAKLYGPADEEALRGAVAGGWRWCGARGLCRLHDAAESAGLRAHLGAARQVDVVPTISAALGLPVPFSSLGVVLPEVAALAFPAALNASIARNRAQLCTYLQQENPNVDCNAADALGWLYSAAAAVRHTRDDVDAPLMLVGIISVVVWAAAEWGRCVCRPEGRRMPSVAGTTAAVLAAACSVLCVTLLHAGGSAAATLCAVAAVVLGLAAAPLPPPSHIVRALFAGPEAAVASAVVLLHMLGGFSNSFVVFSDVAVQFLLCVVAAGVVWCRPSRDRLWSAVALCVLTRTVVLIGGRSRRHHTHTIEPRSAMDDLFALDVGAVSWTAMASPSLAVLVVVVRAALNAAIGAAFQSRRWSVLILAAVALLEYLPVIHHAAYAAAAAVLAIGEWRRPGGAIAAGTAVLCAWFAALCVSPSARLTAAAAPWLIRLAVGAVPPDAPPLALATLVFFVSWCVFFGTGQQAAFSTIEWSAAFVGVPSYSMALCGLLAALRTLFPFIEGVLLVAVFAKERAFRTAQACCAIQASSAAGTALAAMLLRKHLMMWAVFAPNLLFHAAAWMAAAAAGLVSVLVVPMNE